MTATSLTQTTVGALEDAYWDDPEDVERRAREILAAPDAIPDAQRHRLLVLLATVQSRRGENEVAAAQVNASRQWALMHDDIDLRVRCERLLSMIFDRMGDAALALEHAVSANALVRDTDSVLMRAAVRQCLGDALGTAGAQDEARSHYDKAEDLARQVGALPLLASILNNRAYSEHLSGTPELAQRGADRLLDLLTRIGAEPAANMRDTLAAIWMQAGRLEDAEQMLAPYAATDAFDGPELHGVAAALLTLATILRQRGDLSGAKAAVTRCRRVCEKIDLPGTACEAEREGAELFAASGDFRAAFELHKSFHDHSEALRAAQREARGRVLHVMFETDEARRDREVYRSLSERDPLTNLHNRRHVDDTLSEMIEEATRTVGSLAICFVDLDHFKLVNDMHSHATGDTVLAEVAGILSLVAAEHPGGLAARMGGEEFLLALPGISGGKAAAVFEDVRRRIAGHDWRPFTGALAVTASLGAAIAPEEGTDRVSLLHLADTRLYAAKAGGRNQVVLADPFPASA